MRSTRASRNATCPPRPSPQEPTPPCLHGLRSRSTRTTSPPASCGCAASSLRPTRCCTTTSGSRSPSAASPPYSRSSAPGITADHTSPSHCTLAALPPFLPVQARPVALATLARRARRAMTASFARRRCSTPSASVVWSSWRCAATAEHRGAKREAAIRLVPLSPPVGCGRLYDARERLCHVPGARATLPPPPPSRSESRPAPTAPSSLPHISASPHALRVR